MKTKTESQYAEVLAQIVWMHIHEKNFPDLETEELSRLETIFYYRLQKMIIRSILGHVDNDVLMAYKLMVWDKEEQKTGFDYDRFDTLFAIALGNDELMQKVSGDVDKYAEKFVTKSRAYLVGY